MISVPHLYHTLYIVSRLFHYHTHTPFSKRNAPLICPFLLVPLGHWPWHRVFMIKLSPWALSKWHITPVSLAYTLLQKKGIFKNVVFLLEKSVICLSISPGTEKSWEKSNPGSANDMLWIWHTSKGATSSTLPQGFLLISMQHPMTLNTPGLNRLWSLLIGNKMGI